MRDETRVTQLAHPRAGRVAVLVQAGHAVTGGVPEGPRTVTIGDVLPIGRTNAASGNSLCLEDAQVSRRHAQILRSATSYQLLDLGSTNGTFVDGARVTGSSPIRDGSVIAIGPFVSIFRLVSKPAMAAVEDEQSLPFGPVATLSGDAALLLRRMRTLAKVNLDLLLTGETGVGKEVYARAIHGQSGRAGRFIAINCAAIPENLIESELFGFARGAHSTATDAKAGLLEEADRGTLFLDEIGDMPLPAQTKLLRFLQDRKFVPLGSTRVREVDVRIIAATRRGISTQREDQGLRLDLAARLGPEPIRIPSLRARIEDVGALVQYFLRATPRPFSSEAFTALFLHNWPGNIRELEKVITLAAIMSENDEQIGLEHLTESIVARALRAADRLPPTDGDDSRSPPPSRDELEDLLREHQGDVARVARQLGRQRTLVWRWIKKQGCNPSRYRDAALTALYFASSLVGL